MEVSVYAGELLAAAKLADNKKNKENRPKVHCVYVECNDDGYVIASTDSIKMIEFSAQHINDYHLTGSCVISIDDIKTNVKASDKYVIIKCEDGENTLSMYKGKKDKPFSMRIHRDTVAFNPCAWKYLCYKQILEGWEKDEKNVYVMSMNATYLADICNAVEIAYGKDIAIDEIYTGKNKPIVFHNALPIDTKRGRWFSAMLMPVRKK